MEETNEHYDGMSRGVKGFWKDWHNGHYCTLLLDLSRGEEPGNLTYHYCDDVDCRKCNIPLWILLRDISDTLRNKG